MIIAEVPDLRPSRIIDEHQEPWLAAELAARVVPPRLSAILENRSISRF
jgi:hypothetical protein